MAWTTYTAVNFRQTLAFAADNAGEVALLDNPNAVQQLPTYTPAISSRSPLSVNGNSFNIGWLVNVDGVRDRTANSPSSSDHRTAGVHFSTSGTLQMQFGSAPGIYRIVAGFGTSSGSGPATFGFSLKDANGTLMSATGLTGTSGNNKFYDIGGVTGVPVLYATAAAWATANPAGGPGNYFQFTTSDASNGNGGPLLQLVADGTGTLNVAHIAIQYMGNPGVPNQCGTSLYIMG